jgi:hypothetical protein
MSVSKSGPKPVQLITYTHKYSDLEVTSHESRWDAVKELIDFVKQQWGETIEDDDLLTKFKTRRYGSCKAGLEWVHQFFIKNDPGIVYSIVNLKLPKGYKITKAK